MKKMYELGRQLMAQGKMLIEMSGESDMPADDTDKPEKPGYEDGPDNERSTRNKMLAASLKRNSSEY